MFFFAKTFVELIELPFFFIFFAVIYGISPEIAMIPLYASLGIIVINLLHHFPLKKLGSELFVANKKRQSFLVQLLSGKETLRLDNGFSKFTNIWQAKIRYALGLSRSTQIWNNSMATTLPILVQAVSVTVVLVGAYQHFSGKLSVGGLIACTILSGRAILPILNFSSALTKLLSSRHMLKSWKNILTHQTDYDLTNNVTLNNDFKGDLLVKDLHFKYNESGGWALENINLTLKRGERLAIVGPSGAGKSTFVRVLCQIEKAERGSVLMDGFSLKDLHPFELYRNINYMPQNPSFFSGTIYENIRLNSQSFNSHRLQEMVQFFGFNNLNSNESIESGLSFQVGEGGQALSGGQKQLIALMRCLCTDSVIYILDEPTSGMDGELEKKVIEYIDKLMQDKTLIIITHRPSLLTLVNNLLILNQGKIVERGPKELMTQKYFGSTPTGSKIVEVPLKQARVV